MKLEGIPISINSIKNRNNIKVYYYGRSQLALETDGKKYLFPGAEDGIPTNHSMSFSAIEFANGKSPVFATGTLVFDENEREQILEALGRIDWRDAYWSEDDIENLLLHPTVAELNRMLRIRDIITIERVRGRMVFLKNTALVRPSERVIELVNHRYDEVMRGAIKSSKTITAADAGITKEMEESAVLKQKNAKLEDEMRKQRDEFQAQMKLMQEQMAQLLAMQSKPVESESPKKPAGRPPKKT